MLQHVANNDREMQLNILGKVSKWTLNEDYFVKLYAQISLKQFQQKLNFIPVKKIRVSIICFESFIIVYVVHPKIARPLLCLFNLISWIVFFFYFKGLILSLKKMTTITLFYFSYVLWKEMVNVSSTQVELLAPEQLRPGLSQGESSAHTPEAIWMTNWTLHVFTAAELYLYFTG